jgi:hypothetical protein
VVILDRDLGTEERVGVRRRVAAGVYIDLLLLVLGFCVH